MRDYDNLYFTRNGSIKSERSVASRDKNGEKEKANRICNKLDLSYLIKAKQ